VQAAEGAKVGLQALPSWLAAVVGTAEVREPDGTVKHGRLQV